MLPDVRGVPREASRPNQMDLNWSCRSIGIIRQDKSPSATTRTTPFRSQPVAPSTPAGGPGEATDGAPGRNMDERLADRCQTGTSPDVTFARYRG